MGSKDHSIVGLDLGSNKTCAVIGQPGKDGKLGLAGFGVAESKGWRKGVIANLDLVVLSVKKAVEAAESMAGVPIDAAYLGVGGGHVKGVNARGALALSKPAMAGKPPAAAREVSREDLRKAIEAAQRITLPPDRSLLHVLPQEFLLDSQDSIRDPVGMVGRKLEADVHLITASATAAQNAVTAVNRAGIVVLDTVYEPLAGAEACLTADERELGVGLIDVGAGSTDLVVYYQGAVRHTAAIPVGGEHFTNDVAVGLRTPIPEAEKMKRAWGERDPEKPQDSVMEVSGVGDRPSRLVTYAMLSEIIEPRAMELLELIQAELTVFGFGKQLGAGLVMTGGGAKLGGLATLAEQTLGLPVRIGRPKGLEKMGEVLPDPAFASVVGLVAYGNRLRLMRDSQERGWTGKFFGIFRGAGKGDS